MNDTQPSQEEMQKLLKELTDCPWESYTKEEALLFLSYIRQLEKEKVELLGSCTALEKQNKRSATVEDKATKYELLQSRMIKMSKQMVGKERLIEEDSEWNVITKCFDCIERINERNEALETENNVLKASANYKMISEQQKLLSEASREALESRVTIQKLRAEHKMMKEELEGNVAAGCICDGVSRTCLSCSAKEVLFSLTIK